MQEVRARGTRGGGVIGALMTHSASRWLRTGRPARPASCSRRRPCPTQCACAATSSAAQRRRRRRRHACQHRRDTVSTEGTAARGPRRRRARARWRAPAAAVHAHAHDPAPGLLRTFAAPALRPPKPRSRFTFRKETMETSFFAVVFVLHYDFANAGRAERDGWRLHAVGVVAALDAGARVPCSQRV
jgi:hypothetical protein